jgi:hypothetical protein
MSHTYRKATPKSLTVSASLEMLKHPLYTHVPSERSERGFPHQCLGIGHCRERPVVESGKGGSVSEPTTSLAAETGEQPAVLRRYLSDFGSEWFLGLFLSRRATNSCAQEGVLTRPRAMMSFAFTF